MDTQLIVEKKVVVFVSQPNYEPAQRLIDLLQADIGLFKVVEIDDLDNSKADFEDSYTAVMFITPADFPKALYLSNAAVEIVREFNLKQLIWIAPSAERSSGLEQALSRAAEIIKNSGLETIILRHAPIFSDLLNFQKEIKFRRTLSLPLENNSLPWVAPEDIAEGIYKWLAGTNRAKPPKVLTGRSQLGGIDLAQEISTVLERNLDGIGFARRCFKAIDTNNSGDLDRDEMFAYLEQLAYSQEEAEELIEQADTNQDGSIDFDEFVAGLGRHLDKILADLPRQVQYVNVPPSTVLYDLQTRGLDEQSVRAWLALIHSYHNAELAIDKSCTEWLGRGSTSFGSWLENHVLNFVNVYILPSRGILTISEGTLAGKPALTTRMLQSDDRLLVGVRTLDNRSVEWKWENRDTNDIELVKYETDRGGQRTLRFKDDQLVGMSVQGTWLGRKLANNLMFKQESLPRWQINLFRELGELQIEEVNNLVDPDSIVCNCTQTTCGQLQEMIAGGLDTLEKIAEATQITMICGGCQPLVEEMLGSANLDVAEMMFKQDLGRGIFRFQFRPVNEPVISYLPGQHLLIQGRVDGVWVTRAYTLSSNADQNRIYEITVKREEMGLFSRWLCDRADKHALFRISQPRGEYILENEPEVYFFAGGIGVTPAISMMRTLASRKDQRPFYLDWSAPQPQDFVFQKELNFIQRKFPNFKVKLTSTRTEGRLTTEKIQENYSYKEGAVAFLCGPQVYMDAVRSHLLEAGWADDAIRQELFSSKLDEEGNAEPPKRAAVQVAGGIKGIESYSFDVQPVGEVAKEAEAYLKQCYVERGLPEVFLPRWQEVREEIAKTGKYEHTLDELSYGARLAWRNSSRCVGRYFWQSLQIRDMRHLETEEEMYGAIVDHIKIATNKGDLRALMTAFKPDGRRLWNAQLLRYAGYKQEDGMVLGDPANVEFTEQALELGWKPPANPTPFDYLPLVIQLPGKEPKWFDIPPEIILDVKIVHPDYEWFEELGLKWYALPAVCNMSLDLGGVQYTCTPFNGFYMGTEIGGRNFSDTYRYNKLPAIAKKMGLDCSSNDTLWKDRALIELNVAVLHSFKEQGVRLIDHHSMTDYFMEFMADEQKCQRPIHADWGWIVPPISGSLTPVYPLEFENRILKPNYFYMSDAWKSGETSKGKCPFAPSGNDD
ncbi:nitric oxide synthase oxygenase [Waterburya agarophytonicola K14]|uniref:Nitric oxide synthase oxygenase n=1 Tax=Waterburya agarophytonicola KI4 TaxID=2874699 RepID=A0A964BPK0_9CYAN|nr:nitric oxide synthase oxygenase [Waterburya agarophytonicola]MCC0176153.1 nitric oxide synthase oxygenase [Waterburya agarophytonicola KI4]